MNFGNSTKIFAEMMSNDMAEAHLSKKARRRLERANKHSHSREYPDTLRAQSRNHGWKVDSKRFRNAMRETEKFVEAVSEIDELYPYVTRSEWRKLLMFHYFDLEFARIGVEDGSLFLYILMAYLKGDLKLFIKKMTEAVQKAMHQFIDENWEGSMVSYGDLSFFIEVEVSMSFKDGAFAEDLCQDFFRLLPGSNYYERAQNLIHVCDCVEKDLAWRLS